MRTDLFVVAPTFMDDPALLVRRPAPSRKSHPPGPFRRFPLAFGRSLLNQEAMRQLAMRLPSWGGKRRGAGRRPNGPKAGVSHLRRSGFAARHPVHATV